MTKPVVWKTRCDDCDPICDDPWQVDVDWPKRGGTFATWAEALAYALEQAK